MYKALQPTIGNKPMISNRTHMRISSCVLCILLAFLFYLWGSMTYNIKFPTIIPLVDEALEKIFERPEVEEKGKSAPGLKTHSSAFDFSSNKCFQAREYSVSRRDMADSLGITPEMPAVDSLVAIAA
eukprot:gene19266-6534_t